MLKLPVKMSLRGHLFVWLLPAMLLLLLAGATNAYLIALRTVTESYDHMLLDEAADIAEQVHPKNGTLTLEMTPAVRKILLNDEYDHIYYLVLGPREEFISGSPGLPRRIPESGAENIFYDANFLGEKIRAVALITHTAGASLRIVVAETLIRREALFRKIWLAILVPELALMSLTGILLWFGVRYGLSPLTRLSRDLSQRSHLDLTKIDETHAPEEAQPLVNEINLLLLRLDASLQAQRAFISDAAHQIRTPIAALQAQVELALQQRDSTNLVESLQQILTGVRRTTHLANQLLSLARAEPGGMASGEFRPVDLQLIVEAAAEIWVPYAIDKDIDLGFELEHAKVKGSPVLLRELVSNLVDNAIRYTPVGGRITVRVSDAGDSVLLEVEDNGPGIAVEEHDKIFKRFYRPLGSPEGGCGLGLAIVEEITRLHRGTVEITASTTGTRSGSVFSVRIPTCTTIV